MVLFGGRTTTTPSAEARITSIYNMHNMHVAYRYIPVIAFTRGHAESLYIGNRPMDLSFTSRAKKTKKVASLLYIYMYIYIYVYVFLIYLICALLHIMCFTLCICMLVSGTGSIIKN